MAVELTQEDIAAIDAAGSTPPSFPSFPYFLTSISPTSIPFKTLIFHSYTPTTLFLVALFGSLHLFLSRYKYGHDERELSEGVYFGVLGFCVLVAPVVDAVRVVKARRAVKHGRGVA